MSHSTDLKGRVSAALMAVAGALGLGAPAAQSRPHQGPPPAEWVAYAEKAGADIAGWLAVENDASLRVRTHLYQTGEALVVKVWVDEAGVITRVDFAALAEAGIDADIRSLIEGRTLAPPPEGILLPMRLALEPSVVQA